MSTGRARPKEALKRVLGFLGLRGIARVLRRKLATVWLLLRYGAVDRYEANVGGLTVLFSTDDLYSKRWFFPRYGGGKLHEEAVTLLLLETLKGSGCFVDVGANLGWFTCLASKQMPDGIVYGFEMDDLAYALLRKNLEINGCRNVEVHHAAVTEASGTAGFVRSSQTPHPGLQLEPSGSGGDEVVPVEAITLDGFFTDREELPDAVKIDVEGAEMKVLRGMRRIMERSSPQLFVEVHPTKMEPYRSSAKEVITYLIASGYEVLELEEMRRHGADKRLRELDYDSVLRGNTMLYAYKG